MATLPDYEPGMEFAVPPDFDPLTQNIWYVLKNGTLDNPITLQAIDDHTFRNSEWSVVIGCAIGASVMTLLHVLALTPLAKRRTLIYWLNVVGLSEVLFRGIIEALYRTKDTWQTAYVYYSGDSTSVPTLHRIHSTLSVILSLTSIATVEIIFFVQGRAILSSLPRKVYLALLSALVLFGIVAIGVRLVLAVYNLQDIWIWNDIARHTVKIPLWCEPVTLATYVVTVGSWSLVWTCFIGRQIFLRWKMNIMSGKSYGAMNVLFLAGIQSMILPVFFLIMQFVPIGHSFYGADWLVIPSVLCLMPFSSLWAGTISTANGQGCDEPTRKRHSLGTGGSRIPFAHLFSSTKAHSPNHTSRALSGATETGHSQTHPLSPTTPNHVDKLYPELRDDDHIAVTQTYTVQSDQSGRHGSAV